MGPCFQTACFWLKLLTPLSGAALCRSAHRHDLLHLRRYWDAGELQDRGSCRGRKQGKDSTVVLIGPVFFVISIF